MFKNKISIYSDHRGILIPYEFSNLDFEPKRIFIVNNVPINEIRGNHSHKETKQLLICVNGSVNVYLDDGYTTKKNYLSAGESILIPEMVWDSQEFLENNSEIVVICSTHYNEKDYIFDYEEFKKIKKNYDKKKNTK
jgi:dTDP-4-dehydrorhamnose 3,5-epimerase-like enzyme